MSAKSPRITYWAGRGLAEPLRCLLAVAGVRFENNFLTSKEQMQELIASGKLAYDQVPLVEVGEGVNLVQSYPTAVYLAQMHGLWPADPLDQFLVGHINAACQDARLEAFCPFPFHGDKGRVLEIIRGPRGLMLRYTPKWEEMLGKATGPFFLGEKPSLADVGVFEVMDFFRDIFGEKELRSSFEKFPRLLELHDAVLGLGYMGVWRDEERPKLFLDAPTYAETVKQTLPDMSR